MPVGGIPTEGREAKAVKRQSEIFGQKEAEAKAVKHQWELF